MNYKEAVSITKERRKNELDLAVVLFNEALEQSPELLKVERQLRAIVLDEAKGKKTDNDLIKNLESQKQSLLKKMGLDNKKLNPMPKCKKCNDTAFLKNDYCDCVKALVLNNKENCEIPLVDFKDIDYKRFDPAHLNRNKEIYDDLKKLCAKYPDNKRKIVMIFGSTGSGKTLLASCCTNEFFKKGYSAVAVSAFSLVQRALKYHTSFDENKQQFLDPLLDSDLLVIDDLGTENILKNVTNEYLYIIITERLNANKLTVITSNMSKDGILNRYGERIYSRLFDKEKSYHNILNGKDLRLI